MAEPEEGTRMSTTTRRDFVKAVVATSGAALVGCGSDDPKDTGTAIDAGAPDGAASHDAGAGGAQPAMDARPPLIPPEETPESSAFPLGISAGDVSSTSAIVWTQYAGAKTLVVTVWLMDGENYASEMGTFDTEPADSGFVHVDVEGLTAGSRFRYAFFEVVDGKRKARSPIGRFRAAIADDSEEVLVFGAVSCTDRALPFDTLARAAERTDLDAFLFLGDNSYCDGAEVLADYRALYVEHFGKPEHRALRASTSMLITWDDHEVENDFFPELIGAQKLADATQAFFEHAPVGRASEAPNRIWRKARWGKTAEIFVLDCRSERRTSTIFTGEDQYLSPEQLAWLKQGLKQSQAKFKLILNSVPITNMPFLWDAYTTDRWEAYPKQRDEILDFIDSEPISGTVWLSGDFHLAFISHVASDGPGASQLEVLVGPGAQTPSPLAWTLQAPQFEWATDENNYVALHLDPKSETLRVVHHDGAGGVLHDVSYPLS
jgi:alkaline phosphatase D